MTREALLQAVRAWLQASASPALTDYQVIPADDPGPRPPLPYLTVKVLSFDVGDGIDEVRTSPASVVVVDTPVPEDPEETLEGYEYALEVNGQAIEYTRLDDDTDATVAAALAALIDALDDVAASTSDTAITIAQQGAALAVAVDDEDPALTLLAGPFAVEWTAGDRSATVSVQAFGAVAGGWLADAASSWRLGAARAALDDAGVAVTSVGAATDLSQLIDTAIEQRAGRDFGLAYGVRGRPAAIVIADVVGVDATLTGRSPDLDLTFSIEGLTP